MKKALLITDLTRMGGMKVCIAGLDKTGNCIRPMLWHAPGIPQQCIQDGKRAVIFQSAVVEFELREPIPHAPHTEDRLFDLSSIRFIERATRKELRSRLDKSTFHTIRELFGQPIMGAVGRYVYDGFGPRSIGTIQPRRIAKVIYEQDRLTGSWDYRLAFEDNDGEMYRLKITDLTWQYYCQHMRGPGQNPKEIATKTSQMLQDRAVLLRIGLARGWAKFPDRCYLQITGIFTFPDYLGGKTFLHFM
jgi:hypothetical protein